MPPIQIEDDARSELNSKANVRLAGFIFASAVGLTVGLTAPFIFSKSSLPYMATPSSKVRLALQYLGKGRKGGVFVDLGSGDGEAVYQAARLGYKAIGLELNFTLWAFSSLRRAFFWSAAERANSQLLWTNLFEYDLKNANTIMIFGVNPLMESLSQKLASQCTPGTHILSYRFAIPLTFHERNDLLRAKIIYEADEMRIYEKSK